MDPNLSQLIEIRHIQSLDAAILLSHWYCTGLIARCADNKTTLRWACLVKPLKTTRSRHYLQLQTNPP